MKIVSKTKWLVIAFLLSFYSTCYADVIMPGQSPEGHGRVYPEPTQPATPEPTTNYILIGAIALAIIVCVVIITVIIMKKKKSK